MSMFDKFKPVAPAAAPPAAPTELPPAPVAAPAGAVNLSKVERDAPALVNLHKAAGVVLAKRNLTGVKAAVYLVLDYSGSMSRFYRDGVVQGFTEKVLAAAAHFDDDGDVPVVLFDNRPRPAQHITLSTYQGAVQRMVGSAGRMGTTDYAKAMQAVIDHYTASGATEPALVIFQTDGSPDNRSTAEKVLCDASRLPIFWQFVGFGNDEFKFLRKLDALAVPRKRVIDNAGFFAAGANPMAMPDTDLYENLMGEFPQWLASARQQQIVR